MKKRSLVWIAPAIALTLSLGYLRTAPDVFDEPESRPPRVQDENVAQTELQSRRRSIRSNDDLVIDLDDGSATSPGAGAKDCTVVSRYLLREDGSTTELYTCEPVSPGAKRPYESYSNEALASLAYSDAKAAEILGMRLRDADEEAAMSLTFRASALSGGNADSILAFSNAYPHPSSINNVPVLKTIHKKFVMSAVAEMLGAPVNNLDYWEDRIRDVSSDSDREIARLQAQARKIVDEMRQIQLNVFGSSNIGGQDDA